MHRTNFLLSQKAHDQIHDLSKRASKQSTLNAIIENYDGAPLEPDVASASTYTLTDENFARLDQIKTLNNLKSRNQTVELLINQAWERRNAAK